jgi:hypothetical protein
MRRSQALAALAAVVLATPTAVWCLMGDRSEPDGYLRMFEPPTIGRGLELVIGAMAAGTVVMGGAVAARARRDGLLDRRHHRATTPLVIAGVLLAAGGRVVTSATVGANIGGGLLLLVAPFALPPLMVIGIIRWSRLLGARASPPEVLRHVVGRRAAFRTIRR